MKFTAACLILFSTAAASQTILPISKICDQEILDQIDNPTTKNPDLFSYYIKIIEGSCYQKVKLSDKQKDRLISYFAEIGSSVAKYLLDPDLEALLSSARKGDKFAQFFFILKNSNYLSIASKTTAPETIEISEEESKFYIKTMIDYALKGDVRATLPALFYMLDSANTNYLAAYRFNIIDQIINDYGQYSMDLAVMLNMWKLNFMDFSICTDDSDASALDKQNMVFLCGLIFDRDLYNKLGKMTEYERLEHFTKYISSLTLPEPDIETADSIDTWNKNARIIGVYALYGVPYSIELLPFLVLRPSSIIRKVRASRNNILPAEYWFKKYDYQSKDDDYLLFCNLIILSSEAYMVNSPEALVERLKGEVPYIEKAYIMNLVNHRDYDQAESLLYKRLFDHGDIDSLFYLFRISYEFKLDPVKQRALLDIYAKYRPVFAKTALSVANLLSNQNPDYLEKVAKFKKSIEAQIPEDAATTHFFLSWNDELKPFMLKRLEKLINQKKVTQ